MTQENNTEIREERESKDADRLEFWERLERQRLEWKEVWESLEGDEGEVTAQLESR